MRIIAAGVWILASGLPAIAAISTSCITTRPQSLPDRVEDEVRLPCADVDRDGVCDVTDKCLEAFGPSANKGCPY